MLFGSLYVWYIAQQVCHVYLDLITYKQGTAGLYYKTAVITKPGQKIRGINTSLKTCLSYNVEFA